MELILVCYFYTIERIRISFSDKKERKIMNDNDYCDEVHNFEPLN